MTKDEVLENLKYLASQTSHPYLTVKDLRKIKKLEFYLYTHFDNFNQALSEAGLPSSRLSKSYATSDEELLKYLWELGKILNKIPSSLDVNKDRKYNYHIFKSRGLGSIKEAYELAKKKYDEPVSHDVQVKLPETLSVVITEQMLVNEVVPIKEDENKNRFYGVAAENLLVAELLYRLYEAYLINVDIGVDVFAYKDNRPFYIQVKNISFDKQSTRTISITKSSYVRNKFNNMYYCFIMQKDFKRDYVIIPYLKLQEYENKDLIITDTENKISLTFKKEGDDYLMVFQSERDNLSSYTNQKGWDTLK